MRTPHPSKGIKRGHVTFDDVTSGDKNFRLRMHTPHPRGTLLGSHDLLVISGSPGTFCTTIVKKKAGKSQACAEHISGYDITFGHVTDVICGSTTTRNAG